MSLVLENRFKRGCAYAKLQSDGVSHLGCSAGLISVMLKQRDYAPSKSVPLDTPFSAEAPTFWDRS